jgi:fumarylacetoacetase
MSSPLPGYAEHFGINNIPFGLASSKSQSTPAAATRFQDHVIFLNKLDTILSGVEDLPKDVFSLDALNAFAALPRAVHQEVRQRLQQAISKDESLSDFPSGSVEPIEAVTMHLPVTTADFTDFSLSAHHVQNASEAVTGTRSTPPSFYHQPVGYAGRCSSLDISGTPVERPLGQYWEGKPGASKIVFGPCKKMDYELEVGAIIGKPLPRKERVLASKADEHVFGYVLLNDWSARDIQVLEMNPLGPLNGKNAGTTISPWIVTTDALKAFETAAPAREQEVAPHLITSGRDALDVKLEVHVSAPGAAAQDAKVECKSNMSWMYWTIPQCIAHQAIGGCGLRTGDILATGTVSGGADDEHGCLMEFMKLGTTPPRGYLEDGETVTLTGFCGGGVGFGECVAKLTPARPLGT